MANFDTIKTAIDANINTNGNQAITGAVMNSILKQMVDSTDAELTESERALSETIGANKTETDTKLTELEGEINGLDSLGFVVSKLQEDVLIPTIADQSPYETASNNHVSSTGGRVADSTCDIKKYLFESGDIVRVKIKKDYDAVYQWQTSSAVPGGVNTYIVGDIVTTETDGYIVAPDVPQVGEHKYVYLVFSQKKDNATNEIKKVTYIHIIPALSKEVSVLNNRCFGVEMQDGYYYDNNGKIGYSDNNLYSCYKTKVSQGESYLIRTAMASSQRKWILTDERGVILRTAESSPYVADEVVSILEGETYLYVSNDKEYRSSRFYNLAPYQTQLDNIKSQLGEVKGGENRIDIPEERNNANVVLDKIGNIHLSFDYKWNGRTPFTTTGVFTELCSIYGEMLKACFFQTQIDGRSSEMYQTGSVGIRAMSQNGVSVTSQTIGNQYEYFQSDVAFSVRYTGTFGNSDVVKLIFSNNTIRLTINGVTQDTISVSSDETIDFLVSKLNGINGITAKAIESTGRKCSELLFFGNSGKISLELLANSLVSGSNVYEALTFNVPYALDKRWHNVEVIIDMDANKGYVAFDGLTFESTIDSTYATDSIISIGQNAPIIIKNIHVDVDNFGDAEIVTSYASDAAGDNAKVQMISNINPKLIIFEGHGVLDTTDALAPTTGDDALAVTTDRLHVLFGTLREKGYIPITWQDVIDWKIGYKRLPKRCYVVMMDDWRLANYVDYYKRIPFEKFNVKTGLAVSSDQYQLDDVRTIDGKSFKVSEMMDMVVRAGWYPCSHTSRHTPLTTFTNTELESEVRDFCYSCNEHRIYSDILVYPQGEYRYSMNSIMRRSAFKLGIAVVSGKYPCKFSNDFYLPRVEIGTRLPLEKVLLPIV